MPPHPLQQINEFDPVQELINDLSHLQWILSQDKSYSLNSFFIKRLEEAKELLQK